MSSIWVILIVGFPAVMTLQVDKYCVRGFRAVLEGNNCDYYAYGPQTLMTSYCHWDEQPYYGITSKFCCAGSCAYCFRKFSREIDSQTNEEVDEIVTELPNGISEENTVSPEFEKLLVTKIERMITQEIPTTNLSADPSNDV